MRVGLVPADDEIGQGLDRIVRHNPDAAQADGAGEAHRRAGRRRHCLRIRQLQVRHIQKLFDLDLVGLVIAADQHGHGLLGGLVQQGLDQAVRRGLQKPGHFLDGARAGRGDLPEWPGRLRRGVGWSRQFGSLHVGGVGAVLGIDDCFFAGVGQHHELVRRRPADQARVRLHGPEGEAAAAEDPLIRVVHLLVA